MLHSKQPAPSSSTVDALTAGFLSLTCAAVPARSPAAAAAAAAAQLPLSLQPPYGIATDHPLKDGLDRLDEAPTVERAEPAGPRLSNRATQGPDAGPLIERFACLFNDVYDKETNPAGIISLGVAENFLMAPELMAFFRQAFAESFTVADLSYGDHLWGSRRLMAALAAFYTSHFHPVEPIWPQDILTANGCSALLDQLFHVLLDQGEGVLLSQVTYAGFARDLRPRSGTVLVGVPLAGEEGDDEGDVDARFGQSLRESEANGVKIRAMLVCNPTNPHGRTHSRQTLLAYCLFAQKHGLHLVSDEIYALSTYDNADWPGAEPFTSMLSLDVDKETGVKFDKSRLHVVHGMSKDFCSNGLRLGVLLTPHNPRLVRVLAQTSMLMKVSSPADVLFSALLTSPRSPTASNLPFVDWFIGENRRRLTDAHALVRTWFEKRGVRVADSCAGHFAWVQLGDRLGWSTVAQEKAGFQRMLDGGVYLAPGSAYNEPKAGWFRVTFAVERATLLAGLARVEQILDLRPVAQTVGGGGASAAA